MPARPRVLFLALDAMDPDLISRWAGCGVLPAFRSLFERTTHGPTRNPPGLYVGAVWPSFSTGASPARHGRYCYEQLVSGSYDIRRTFVTDLEIPPFWSQLSAAGRRIAVVDVPKSPRGMHLNGVQLVNWGVHDPDPGAVFETWPEALAEEIKVRFGADPIRNCNLIDRTAHGIHAFRRGLQRRIEARTAICRDLLERDNWDLFLAGFSESHCAGHQCWVLHDETHLSHDRTLARAVGDPLKDVYVALDGAVGRLLEQAGPDTAVFVMTSHGMGPHYDATYMLDEILQRLDPTPMHRIATSIERLRRAVLRRIRVDLPLRTLPVAHRRFFAIPNNDVYGGIRVNLVGREPHGRVQPGAEFDALFTQLREHLLELKNADTGGAVVRDLVRLDQVYEGPCLHELPDFYVEWNREAPITRVASPRIGTLHKLNRAVRTGDHKAEGYFWATGPGVRTVGPLGAVSVTDFAPTIAALLDVRLRHVDGTPITAVLKSAA